MGISRYLAAFMLIAVVFAAGCTDDGPSSTPPQKDSDDDGFWDSAELRVGTDPNNADTDGDGISDYREMVQGTDPLSPDKADEPVAGMLMPYGKIIYTAGPTMGAYDEGGVASFTWTFSDPNGAVPREGQFLCLEPAELPADFWPKYDDRSALGEQEWVGKTADNLYIEFGEEGDGIITFTLDTSRISGRYAFKVCGILDNDYIDEKSYAGDGDEVVVSVVELGLVVVDKACVLLKETEYTESYGCYWEFEYADGSEFRCGHLDPPQPYGNLTAADGRTIPALFEISKEEGGVLDSTFILSSSRGASGIHRSDRWTLCDAGQPCGCCRNPNFEYASDKDGLCVKEGVREGGWVKFSIGVNPNHFEYNGDGDELVVSYTG